MSLHPSQSRIQELSDGYVLGILEGEDLEEMERLLAARDGPDSDGVRNAMRSAEKVVALLAWSAPAATPDAALRKPILENPGVMGVGKTTLPSVLQAVARAKVGFVGRARWVGWLGVSGWAVAAALAGVTILLNVQTRAAQRDLAELQIETRNLRTEAAGQEKVLAIIGAGDSHAIRLISTSVPAPRFRAYWSQTAGLVLTGTGVNSPGAGRTLQLWIVPTKGAPVSAGVFAPSAKGQVLLIASNQFSPDAAQALAISDEPLGGSPQPTTQPAWMGAVGQF